MRWRQFAATSRERLECPELWPIFPVVSSIDARPLYRASILMGIAFRGKKSRLRTANGAAPAFDHWTRLKEPEKSAHPLQKPAKGRPPEASGRPLVDLY